MKNSDDFFNKVYIIVRQIPFGKVTTYGHIAEVVASRGAARMVGYALNAAVFMEDVPAHRVINRFGLLSGRRHFPGNSMQEMLLQEGIEFVEEYQVNLEKHLWIPSLEL